jgi:addiction module HigA family antidote
MQHSSGALGHPGAYVRKVVIPSGMSVTAAAQLLGVGRPALSNFLNGKSSLSHEMAVRLEKTFSADSEKLLDMQAAYDRQVGLEDAKQVAVRAFVPNFLTIKAREIEDWAGHQIDARTHLPVLLRKLVHSTGNDLRYVDFPGYDNAQRKGSDGFVEAGTATPWIPGGSSYWEFGTDQNPSGKAESDYTARLNSIDPAVRAISTFVFVTPRNWNGRGTWEKQKNEAGNWKAVRALDASDLEQWLEQSVPAQIWLAEQLNRPVSGYETLEMAWNRWAGASEPHLKPEIFSPAIAAYRDTFKAWLNKPSDRPFVVSADSREEALAFLACLFNEEELRHLKDLAAVFTSPETLRTVVASSVPFIPIVHSIEAQRELIDAYRRLHCIILRPRNAVDSEADVKLDLLNYDAFKEALISMGLKEDDVDRLARESGRSPTILRRRLSKIEAIRVPDWARDDDRAKALIPMALIGVWHIEMDADRKLVSKVADRKYEVIEDDIARLLQFDDSPVWSIGQYRGVASKLDAMFAIARMVTSSDLKRFFVAAEYVLSESDPALELPEKDRWAASLYNKTRNHSSALRTGICETLVILSVHGNNLFQNRLGLDVDGQVARLIRKLLTPLTLERLLSQDRDLPRYAEASPDTFLSIIEEDLERDEPIVFGLLKPVDSGLLGAFPSRTGLLWALECIAWNPKYLPRVASILAKLSKLKIDDNWANKPEASLSSIFRSWMPQTAATVDQRYKVIQGLSKRFPDAAWDICIKQTKPGSRVGNYNYKPNWRGDASGAGQVVTHKEMYDFNRKALDLLIAWPAHDAKTLGDLVESLQGMPDEDKSEVWDLIDRWAMNADEASKATLRECIRQFAFTRRSRHRNIEEATLDRAREAYESLRPQNSVIRHGWLFANSWVQESIDEIEDEEFDYRKHNERIDKLRREAMTEIWVERGFEGARELIINSNAVGVIGQYVTSCVSETAGQVSFIQRCLSLDGDLRSKAEWCVQGFILAIEDDARVEVLQAAAQGLPPEERIRLFVCAPFQSSTWRLVDEYDEDIQTGYWKNVFPSWGTHTSAELTELTDSLLAVKRPRAAFRAVNMNFQGVETSRLKRILYDVVTVDEEPAEQYKLDSYHISEAFDSLDGRPGVTQEEMAQLEFLFIDALDYCKHGIPNLEAQVTQSPVLFVQLLAFAYKRSDGEQDSPEWGVKDPESRAAVASAAYRLLKRLSRIPGMDESGEINASVLIDWLVEARRLCREYSRVEIGDQCLGQLLAKAPAGENGIWPCQAVCESLEEMASPEIGRGFSVGVYNSRGVHFRGPGGQQERELASEYRARSERLYFDYPYVGGILEDIAESYEREAKWHDSEADLEKRLPH